MARKAQPKSRKLIFISIALVLGLTVTGVVLVLVWSQPGPVVSSIPLTLEECMTYEVVNTYPHDPESFTQGLIYLDGVLYESHGLYGQSGLRMVDLATGEIRQQVFIAEEFFGEGLTDWGDTLVQLTWQEGAGFVYSLDTFELLSQFTYTTEGWGLTHDDERLMLSDGSSTIYFLDPDTFDVISTVDVTDEGTPVIMLNELEYIRGEIFANIWQTDDIIRIDPETGEVKGWIDLTGLLPEEDRTPSTNVLNGIAYDAENDRLFVTGKRWPKLYEIRLVPIDGGE